MKRDNEPTIDIAGRLKDLEYFTEALTPRQSDPDAIPINEAPTTRVPVPRRSRVFLRSGGGHGMFAELTLTAPQPHPALD